MVLKLLALLGRRMWWIFICVLIDDEVSEPKTSDDQNILLLHGTEVPNVEGVLKEGLKPSKTEMFCLVVYPTNSIKTASEYCE